MLGAICRAVEERDQTQGHGARVGALAEPVARRLGWDAQRIATLRLAALLHDVGKVSVRREVLLKAGPLTLDELAQIRVHPRAGAELVGALRTTRRVLPHVLSHHEWWDGNGYPERIAGSSIPVEGRLLAIADAFDAMTSSRPYRRAMTRQHALREIEACAGTQFDPELAALFVAVWTNNRSSPAPGLRAMPRRRASPAPARSPRR